MSNDQSWTFFAVIRGCPVSKTGHLVQVQQNSRFRPKPESRKVIKQVSYASKVCSAQALSLE